ncbi:hypothetical protein FB45DRAFT_865197 [Roridomyces roridus]|uniref:Uncharacterized protein n=1 Tax=Roridomyces roridus TaxID=1738132 RepID=A0AAD7BYT2_9AGAR|nr:hypothetical protein FB45DRAFT_865197 [Roridomyces roridus]
MPVMANSAKLNNRFSPLSSPSRKINLRSVSLSPRPSRIAAQESLKHTSLLFGTELTGEPGQGFFASQVSDTQYYGQYGVDVSTMSPVAASGFSQPVDEEDYKPIKFWDWRHDDAAAWDSTELEAVEAVFSQVHDNGPNSAVVKTEIDEGNARVPVSTQEATTDVNVKPEPRDDSDSDSLDDPNEFVRLSSLEKWVVRRMRQAKEEGRAFSDWVRSLKTRAEHRRRLLDEIHSHAERGRRLLDEIHSLSANLD